MLISTYRAARHPVHRNGERERNGKNEVSVPHPRGDDILPISVGVASHQSHCAYRLGIHLGGDMLDEECC